MNPYTSPETKLNVHRRRDVSALVVVGIVSGFMILLAAGTYNAITTYQSQSNRTESQRRIVEVLSILDNGDHTLQMFIDWKFTTIQFGVPILFWTIAAWMRYVLKAPHVEPSKQRTNSPTEQRDGSAAS